jgi:endo-1,3(4)-beta-glucanase
MTSPSLNRRTLLGLTGGSVAAALGLGGLTACTPHGQSAPAAPTPSTVLDRKTVEPLVRAMTSRTLKTLSMPRLADGLTPPTNHWFSGLVFGDKPQPVFPLPLGFGLTSSGFELWLPKVVVSDKTIGGDQGPRLTMSVDGVKGTVVSAYDDASVVVQLRDSAGAGIAELRLVQGSPTIAVKALKDVTMNASAGTFSAAGSAWQATVGETVFGVTGDVTVADASVKVASGRTATFFVPPKGVGVADLAANVKAVTGTSVTYEIGSSEVTTAVHYAPGPALVVAMPHQQSSLVSPGSALGSYESVFGPLTLYATDSLTWRAKRWNIRTALDLSKLSSDEKSRLSLQVAADVASSKPYPQDTYFGGKALYRDAQLMEIAKAVGANDAAKTVKDRLTAAVQRWTEPKGADARGTECFVYDATYRGMVGLQASFGSDEYNDHHFHYGYFLYAAGVLCADDAALTTKLAPVMDLLAADIASPTDTGYFPQRRTFDAYASHSWASGTSPFADGNNQESTAEATHAWAGLALWARARGNAGLEQEAIWMHSLEAQTALAYWLAPDMSAFSGFHHSIIGIGWGAKRDYATWFSADPAAVLMIQVLPASPSAGYLGAAPDRVGTAVAEAVGSGDYAKQYGDYCLLYSSLAGGDAAKKALDRAPSVAGHIDDGSSMSYLLAYLMTR